MSNFIKLEDTQEIECYYNKNHIHKIIYYKKQDSALITIYNGSHNWDIHISGDEYRRIKHEIDL